MSALDDILEGAREWDDLAFKPETVNAGIEELLALRARIAAMREALVEREWIHFSESHGYEYIGDCSEHMECKSCNGDYPKHSKNCPLAALLKESEE